MTVKTYDPQCLTLAEHFLRDEKFAPDLGPAAFAEHCHSLALTIQEAVEDWAYEPEAPAPAPVRKVDWLARRRTAPNCSFCDEHRNDAMMPPHDASPRCESGKRPHCTCDLCF